MNILYKVSAVLMPLLAIGIIAAQQPPPISIQPPATQPLSEATSFQVIISKLFSFLFWVIMLLAVLFFLIGAFFYLTSAGNEEKVKKAKNYLIYATVGLVIALLSQAIPKIIVTILQ